MSIYTSKMIVQSYVEIISNKDISWDNSIFELRLKIEWILAQDLL